MSEQMVLFEDAPAHTGGYRAPAVQSVAGVTYRQLDYWARTDLVKPSIRGAAGSGSQRLYSFADIVLIKIVKRLLDTGISLQRIRSAIEALREQDITSLSEVTLLCDGVSIYQCVSNDEVIDLLSAGQAVFGIAVGAAVAEVNVSVANFPSESIDTGALDTGFDELAARRQARAS